MGKASLSKKAILAAAIGLIILIGLVLVLTLARGREQEALKPGQFAADDFSVYNNKVQISLGDSEEKVIQQIGDPKDIDFLGRWEYDGLKLHFKDGRLDGITMDDETVQGIKYKTARGICIGSSYQEVLDQYGSNGILLEESGRKALIFLVELVDGAYELRSSAATVVNRDNILVISLNFYTNDVLNHIMIGDYKYAYNP